MLLEVGFFFSQARVSQGIFCLTFLWVCCLFSCMWISIACLFQTYYGLCENGYIISCKCPYKWYHSYGFIVITLDWIHGNAWEDKKRARYISFFIADLRVLSLVDFGHVKLLEKKVFQIFHLNEDFRRSLQKWPPE